MDYQAFLKSKMKRFDGEGFLCDVSHLPPAMFEWQKKIVSWACRKGRCAIWADTGLGKTIMQLAWADQVARQTGQSVLILTPLAVSAQTVKEAERFGLTASIAHGQADITGPSIYVTNYQKLHRFDASIFGGVVLDECFPAGTQIDTPLGSCDIKTLRKGDLILNASGVDVISDVHRREVHYAVAFTAGGKRVTASPNHPVFTQRGWVAAQDLEPGDAILQTAAAVRMVQRDVSAAAIPCVWLDEILREILLSEMEDEPAGVSCEGAYAGSGCKERGQAFGMAQDPSGQTGDRTYSHVESYDSARSHGESLPDLETHEAQTFRAWRQREGHDSPAETSDGISRQWVGSRIECVAGSTASRLSHALQIRLSQQRAQSRYRSGWTLPSFEEGTGHQENIDADFVRVDRLEILEQGHPELERLRDANGKLYFYDLGATRHPSYSVSSMLVHNSSILKSFQGKTKTLLTETFARTPYKLACTATPAPNDHLELGNHSDFLGIMPQKEMLARWFLNDIMGNMTWRLKAHAHTDFWRWVASWALVLRSPADLGYDSTGYDLPALNIHHVTIPTTGIHIDGALFADASLSATTLHDVLRQTAPIRAKKAAEIVESLKGKSCLLWTHTNYEADEIRKVIHTDEVRGSDSDEHKELMLLGFADGSVTRLLTKPSLAGFGMNWQVCHNMIFVGMDYSYEKFYQAVRRCWRYGQTQPVHAYLLATDMEWRLFDTLAKKQANHTKMQDEMIAMMKEEYQELHSSTEGV